MLLIFVIPQFATMFADFGEELPAPTQALISISGFLQGNILFIIGGLVGFFLGLTSLMEPILICFLGIVIGGIVIAMFLPIFRMGTIIN